MCVARRAADAADAFGVIVLQFWSIALSKVGSLLYRFVGYESTNIQHHPGRDALFVPRIENFGTPRGVISSSVIVLLCRRHSENMCTAAAARSLRMASQ